MIDLNTSILNSENSLNSYLTSYNCIVPAPSSIITTKRPNAVTTKFKKFTMQHHMPVSDAPSPLDASP